MYQIIIKKKAKKFIDKLPINERKRIVHAIEQLPNGEDIKKLKGHNDLLRLRIGNYKLFIPSTMENALFMLLMQAIAEKFTTDTNFRFLSTAIHAPNFCCLFKRTKFNQRKTARCYQHRTVSDISPQRYVSSQNKYIILRGIQLMANELDKVQEKHKQMTFRAAAEECLQSKRNVLSPATVRGYRGAMKAMSDKFMDENIHDITAMDVQSEINRLAKKRSPKTVRNYHGFISAILGNFCPNLKLNTTLPQKTKKEPYIPSDEEARKVLKYAETPFCLGVFMTKPMTKNDTKTCFYIQNTPVKKNVRTGVKPLSTRKFLYFGHF